MKLVVLGAGESGVGTAILGKQKGYDVFVSDMALINADYKQTLNKFNIHFEEGKHSKELILNADEVIKSPGIPDDIELIKKIKSTNI